MSVEGVVRVRLDVARLPKPSENEGAVDRDWTVEEVLITETCSTDDSDAGNTRLE